ncbi:cell division protein FtsX [Pikeienuella sp. HZG-20]|uniref:cell division protein FtsX n=1 Tax=Paludibacillus litoralis TaxID=3133267 RepID=UPI0030EC1680
MKALTRPGARLSSGAPSIAPRAGVIGGLIALVAAAMGFLATAGALTGFAADRVAGRWTAALETVATVRVSSPEDRMKDDVAAALAILRAAPGVASAHALSDAESRALLAPWLGPDADIEALPTPALIDVTLEGAGPDIDEIRRRFALDAPGAVWDDHREWRAPLVIAARGLRRTAAIGVLVSIAALAAMVAVAATAALWSGAGVVRTLTLIGAGDRFIARAFERPFAVRAALGAGIGALAAALIALNMPRVEAIDVFVAGGVGVDWRLAVLAPLIAALIASLTALGATRAATYLVLHRS